MTEWMPELVALALVLTLAAWLRWARPGEEGPQEGSAGRG